jgi:hypothetical protein
MGGTSQRDHFLGWQCRIRQLAIRENAGQPSPGMRPRVLGTSGAELADGINVLIIETEPEEATSLFRFTCQKSHDPQTRYDEALRFLASAYYQYPRGFSDCLSATFAADSAFAARLLALGCCRLAFKQFGQRYDLACAVSELSSDHPRYEATFWHNKLFNAALPSGVRILSFAPDWAKAEAEPAP